MRKKTVFRAPIFSYNIFWQYNMFASWYLSISNAISTKISLILLTSFLVKITKSENCSDRLKVLTCLTKDLNICSVLNFQTFFHFIANEAIKCICSKYIIGYFIEQCMSLWYFYIIILYNKIFWHCHVTSYNCT